MVAPTALSDDRLWFLYEKSLEMMHQAVERQWSTTQFFIFLNASVVGGAIALLQAGDSPFARLLSLLAFLGGLGLSVAGIFAMRESKKYYRTIVAKKTLIEERLGLTAPLTGREGQDLAILALGPLAGRKKVAEILADVDAYPRRPIRFGSATSWGWLTLAGLGAFDLFGAAGVAWTLLR